MIVTTNEVCKYLYFIYKDIQEFTLITKYEKQSFPAHLDDFTVIET